MVRHPSSWTLGLFVLAAAPCAYADEVAAPAAPSAAPAIEAAPVAAPTPTPVVESAPAPVVESAQAPVVESAASPAPKTAAAPTRAGGFQAKGVEWRFSAQTFFNYGYVFAGEDSVKKFNAFSFDRAHVNIEPVVDETWSARVTPDIAKPDASGKSYALRVKFAFVDGKQLGGTGIGVRAGMLPTPAAEAHDKVWGFRVLTRPSLDFHGITSISDLGASVGYSWAGGELRAFLTNGEGYEYIETTQGKDATIYLTQELVTGLNLNVGAMFGTWIGGASKFWHPVVKDPTDPSGKKTFAVNRHYDQRLVVPLLLTWETSGLRAGAEAALVRRQHAGQVEDATDGTKITVAGSDAVTGLSAALFVVPKFGDNMEIPVRIARFDPNTDSKTGKDDESINAVVGYAYNFAGMLKLIPNVQIDKKGKDKATVTGFVHLEAKL